MKQLLLCLCIFFSLRTVSQNKNIIVKFSPLALIDEFNLPAIEAGAEFGLSKKLSLYTELGIKYRESTFQKADTSFYASRGYKAKIEMRYYFKNRNNSKINALRGFYVAANMFYTKDYHNTDISYFYHQDSLTIRTDNFGVQKTVIGINLLGGSQLKLRGRFMMDFYAGIGVRFRHITAINKEFDYDSDNLISPIDLTVQGVLNETDAKGGNSVVPNLTLGLRLCYRL